MGILLGNQQTLPDSHYRRLTRFFDSQIAQRKLWKWLLVWMIGYIRRWDGRSMSIYLTLDATCWQFGKQPIQLLPGRRCGFVSGLSAGEFALVLD